MNSIRLSPAAVTQIKSLQADNQRLRIAVTGGGCSGLSYQLTFESGAPGVQDKIFEQNDITIVVDKKSYLYLKNLTLDYAGGLNGKGFTFSNPQATKSCGCGTSFNV